MAERRMLLANKIGDTPPNNEIWYYTIDNKICEPDHHNYEVDNNILIENTYKDKGILKFKNPIIIAISKYHFVDGGESRNLKNIIFPDCVQILYNGILQFCHNIEYIKLPKNLIEIKNGFMYLCKNLQIVEIPKSVNIIRSAAFGDCFNLKQIIYNGTINEWDNIQKDEEWNIGTKDFIIHCTNGDIQL